MSTRESIDSTTAFIIFRSARIEFSIVQDYGSLSLTLSYFAFDGSKTDALGDAFADAFADALRMHWWAHQQTHRICETTCLQD